MAVTLLDAYPLPRIDDIVNDVAKYTVYLVLLTQKHLLPDSYCFLFNVSSW